MKLKYRLLFLPILLFACGVASGQEAGMSVAPFVRGDTAVFRFAPEKRMFWADYKGNAIAIDSLARSIRQHKLSIESGDMKYVDWDFVPLTVPAQRTLRLRRIGAIRSNPISLSMKD